MTNTKTTAPSFIIFGREGGHPRYDANSDKPYKGQYVDRSVCCVYCGRYAPSATKFVYLTGWGDIIENPGDKATNDDLGFYPVGSDCAKLAHQAGVPVYEENGGSFVRVSR